MKQFIKYIAILTGIILLGYPTNSVFGQDGEGLFKAKCSACHIMGKDGTGPNLQGVKAKWEGEEEFLYEWVLNSPKVIAEGKSQRALEVQDYSPTVMPIQDVSLDEAKAIIDFVDVWTAPTPNVTDKGEGIVSETVFVPNYNRNLTIFYILLLVTAILLLAIYVVSSSTANLIKSDLFKSKVAALQEKKSKNIGKVGVGAILVLLGLGWNNSVYALSTTVPSAAKDESLWLYVENSDIYVLLIIAFILLAFLLNQVNMFFKVLNVMQPEDKKIKIGVFGKKKEGKSFTRVLTGAVPIEEEHKIDLGHDYDGIRELDNPMPPWWLAGFFVSIVFAVVYMFHYHVFGTGDLQEVEYEKSVAAAEIEIQAYRDKMAMNVDETNATLMTESSDLMKGKELFLNNCATCHLEDGRGGIGPNLTDDYWIYGGDIKDIYKVIRKGAPNGMPEHQSKFNPIQIQQVSSYVLHLDYVSEQDGGRPIEGEFFSRDKKTNEDDDEVDVRPAEEVEQVPDVLTDEL